VKDLMDLKANISWTTWVKVENN